jgi:hypothetical protein
MMKKGQQVVMALVEGDEQRVTRFYNSAMTKRLQLARVDSMESEDYAGDVMPSWQYAALNTSSQMNKAILVLLEIRDDSHGIRKMFSQDSQCNSGRCNLLSKQ